VITIGEGVRSPDALRDDIPPRLIRDLGEPGKKLGFASTLPIVDPVARSVAWLEVLTPELRAELLQPGAAAGADGAGVLAGAAPGSS